jgi:hypothetical protein
MVWKGWEGLHNTGAEKKRDRNTYASTKKMKPRVGYAAEEGSGGGGSDDTGWSEKRGLKKIHRDRGDESTTPEWMPKRDEKKNEIKKERSHSPSSFKREQKKKDDQNKSARDQYPENQKKVWKTRNDEHSHKNKKQKRDYSRGDNPSRRIRPPS